MKNGQIKTIRLFGRVVFSSERNLSVEKYWVQKLLEGVKEKSIL
jgi:hypothetical protein